MIRRELPRTENAGWVWRPYRTEDRRILLAVFSRSVTWAAAGISWPKPLLTSQAHRECARLQKLSNGFRRKLVRLNRIRQVNHTDGSVLLQMGCDGCGGSSAGCVAVQHENHTPETFEQLALLRLVECRAHQHHHGRYSSLMQF